MPPRKRKDVRKPPEPEAEIVEPVLPQRRTCGTMPVHERLLRSDPAYVRARAASENGHFAVATGQRPLTRTGITVIPVVVHVVHHGAAQNLSEEQVHSQIDALNRDYGLANADLNAVPPPFRPLVADTRIRFTLATTDPDGAPTDGITRTATRRRSFSDDDDVKATSTGGADAWPADRYLNLWTAPRLTSSAGEILGYAQFPGGPARTDGVVIVHSAFGTTGTATEPFQLGRTTTHEVGHWLNLRHIWGDDGTGCSGDDFVLDTPNQGGPNYGRPTFPHLSCVNGPVGDMFMNYMDFVDDAAMVMFTVGQAVRMQSCVEHDRSTIGSSDPMNRSIAGDPSDVAEGADGRRPELSPEAVEQLAAAAQLEIGRYRVALDTLVAADSVGALSPGDRAQADALYREYLAFLDHLQQQLSV